MDNNELVEQATEAVWQILKSYSTRKHARYYAQAALAAIPLAQLQSDIDIANEHLAWATNELDKTRGERDLLQAELADLRDKRIPGQVVIWDGMKWQAWYAYTVDAMEELFRLRAELDVVKGERDAFRRLLADHHMSACKAWGYYAPSTAGMETRGSYLYERTKDALALPAQGSVENE